MDGMTFDGRLGLRFGPRPSGQIVQAELVEEHDRRNDE